MGSNYGMSMDMAGGLFGLRGLYQCMALWGM
jgi:hypothetical protein